MDHQMRVAVRVIAVLCGIIGAIWFLRSIAWVIGLLVVSTLIVYMLHPLLNVLHHKLKVPHGLAVVAVFLLFLLICAATVGLLIPVIYLELTDIADNFPFYIEKFQEYMAWATAQLLHWDIEQEVRDVLVGFSQGLNQALEYILEGTVMVVMRIVDLFFVFFIVFYLLFDFDTVRAMIVRIFPVTRRDLAQRIVALIDRTTGNFIRGSMIRCIVVGLVTGMVLYAIGMPYALLLGLIAGLFNFILYIGPYIAAIPALLLSFSPATPAPWVILIVYIAIQVLDGIFLAPLLLGRAVQLKPVTIIVAILIGGSLGGLLGMVVAVPLAGIVKGVLDIVYEGSLYRDPPRLQSDL